MKKLSLIILGALTIVAPVSARTLNLTDGNVTWLFDTASTTRMPVNNNVTPSTLEVNGFVFPLQNTSIRVDDREITDNVVDVVYEDTKAQVYISGNLAGYVTADVIGAHVVITQSALVSEST